MRGRQAAAPVVLVVAALASAWLFLVAPRDSGDGHVVYLVTTEATNVLSGTEVREGSSRKIGTVGTLDFTDGGRAARVGLRIENAAWPLQRGTRVVFRAAGTVSATNRYLEVIRPNRPGPPLADGAQLPRRDVTIPVEFDGLLHVFGQRTRASMKAFLDHGGVATAQAQNALAAALDEAPQALRPARVLVQDVASDLTALDQLVVSTDHVVDSVRRADPGVATLLQDAGTTFQAVGAQARALNQLLARLPTTLRTTRTTLGHASATLSSAGTLLRDLGPGVRQLRALASPLNATLQTLRDVGPDVTQTLATLRWAAPDISAVVVRVKAQAPEYKSLGSQATEVLGCIRPYTPEIAGFGSTWAGMTTSNDGVDRVARVQPQALLPALSTSSPYTPAQVTKVFPDLTYSFPRPPGMNAGQPWFQPKCGAGKDALDPSKDKEATTPSGSGR